MEIQLNEIVINVQNGGTAADVHVLTEQDGYREFLNLPLPEVMHEFMQHYDCDINPALVYGEEVTVPAEYFEEEA